MGKKQLLVMYRFIVIEVNIHLNTTTDRGLFWNQTVY